MYYSHTQKQAEAQDWNLYLKITNMQYDYKQTHLTEASTEM